MKRTLLLVLLLLTLSYGEELSKLKDFFSRQGYVVDRIDGRVILDLGRGKVRVGEVFKVLKEGREIVHPVTGEVLGSVEEEVGKVRVSEVEDKFSIAEILEDKGISKGDRVKLYYESLCYVGSEEGYFKVSSMVGEVRRGEDCGYVIREFEDGFGVEFGGKAVAFFEKPKPPVVQASVPREMDFELSAKFVLTFPSLPLSADACNLFGSDKDYLAVLFEGELKIYEILDKSIVDYASVKLPSGYPVSVQCTPLEGGRDIILLNLISGEGMSSAIVKVVGGTPVVVKENVPYFLAVLDKSRPVETFIGQRFDGRNLWGEVKKLKLSGEEVVEEGNFEVPSGFRADSAVMKGDILVFTDIDGYLRVFEGDRLLLSERNFGGSYTTAELPGTYEDDNKYGVSPRHFSFRTGGKDYVGVVKNVTSPVYRFLDVTKFSEGEIYVLTKNRKGVMELKKVRGKKFEEAIQVVVRTRDDRIFVITGRTGTLPLQNRGDLFEIEITPF